MSQKTTLSERLKILRKSMSLTQAEFSELINVSTVSVSSYETGAKSPSLDMICNIAQICKVSIDWLCGLSDNMRPNGNLETYSDLFRSLINIANSAKIEFDTISLDQGELFFLYPAIYFLDHKIGEFLTEWGKIKGLYDNGTIGEELYTLWIEKTLTNIENSKVTLADKNHGRYELPIDESC